jgi:cell division septation protein DedD
LSTCVKSVVVLDQLVSGHRQRVPDAVAEPQPVEHPLDARPGVDEQVEDALLDRQPAPERVALQVADRAGLAHRVGGEAVHVRHLDREVELQELRSLAALGGAAGEIGLPERDVSEHLLGEANASHEAAASAARRSGSMI